MNYRPGYAGGGQRVERIMTERRSGRYIPDLYTGGGRQIREVLHRAKIIEPIKPALILPEVLDPSKWWRGKHIYLDDEGEYVISFNGITQTYFHYNTKLVNPKEFKSYWDILDPKWTGKIVVWEPTASGVDGVLRFLYHTPEIGPQFLRRLLGEMNATFTRDKRLFLDWLGTGKFAIAAFQSADRVGVAQARSQGLPINWFDPKTFKEGVPLSTSSGNIALMNRAPHPNAAKVYVNWLLSREGQTVYQKISRDNDSLRIDIPKDDVPPHIQRLAGVNYALLTDPVYLDWEPVFKLVNEVWKNRK
jgi:ABC-type Fe3+ transport system substrate-binding protein